MICASNQTLGVICVVLTIYTLVLFVRVILSWALVLGFRPPISGPFRTVVDAVDGVTEPVLKPLRALIPPVRAGGIGLDLSIIIAFVILFVLRTAIGC